MKWLMKRKLVIAALAVALLGGGAAAVAATQSSSPRRAYLNDVARRLGVSPGALANPLLERFALRSGEATGGPLLTGGRAGVIAPAASYLGVSPAKLRSERRQGKSLAQIAASTRGKSVAGLKAALMAAAQRRLDAAVASGRITAHQASEVLSGLSTHIQGLLERKAAYGLYGHRP